MYIRYYTSSLIFFGYWDRIRLPAGRQGRRPDSIGRRPATARQAETPKYQFVVNYILVFFAYWQSSG
jgi:hypothetical protein